jgi:Virus neck protein
VATNFYFNNFQNSQEQNLIEDLVIESIKIYGHEVWYCPRTIDNEEKIFKEDELATFNNAYSVEMYIKNVEGFEGEGDFLSKFGLQIRDRITFTVSRRSFTDEVTGATRPKEGDMIFFPLTSKGYVVRFVEHEAIFYQMGSLQTFDIICELFEFNQETFNTGVDIIDSTYNNLSFAMANNTQIVTQFNISTIDKQAQNEEFETKGDDILDFTEINPFSEANTY